VTTQTFVPLATADPVAELQALEEERQRRLEMAREKRLVSKAALVARTHGQFVYHGGYTVRVATFPHPTNEGEVVEVWLSEKDKFIPLGGEVKEIRIDTVTVWVREEGDKHPRDPFLPGKSWVRVLSLAEATPRTPVEEQPHWTYIPGVWEEVVSAKAAKIAAEIQEKRRAEAQAQLEQLTRLLVPPRSV